MAAAVITDSLNPANSNIEIVTESTRVRPAMRSALNCKRVPNSDGRCWLFWCAYVRQSVDFNFNVNDSNTTDHISIEIR